MTNIQFFVTDNKEKTSSNCCLKRFGTQGGNIPS
jgi:hypothetical protein